MIFFYCYAVYVPELLNVNNVFPGAAGGVVMATFAPVYEAPR